MAATVAETSPTLSGSTLLRARLRRRTTARTKERRDAIIMKVVTPEISWHGRDPVYSIDFQLLNGDIRRLASCGTDRNIRLWEVKVGKDGKAVVDFLATLTRHTRTVNVVRFSPDGQVLASAGDDSVIMLWKKNDMPSANNIFQGDDDEESRENWSVFKVLRSHLEDVYDISWSSDGKFLISGSVDNSAILWDVKKACRLGIFPDHKSFVQGVAYDPRGELLATMSSDRCCRIFRASSKNCISTISKLTLPNVNVSEEKPRTFRMFHDDTMKSFFRRPAFTPDGSLLIVPAGCIEQSGETTVNTTFIFTRSSLSKPVVHLPGPKKATLAVRCSPVLYELRKVPRKTPLADDCTDVAGETNEWKKYETMFGLPYRMVFAIVSEDSILLHDTQQPQPFAFITNIHYHQLSDIAWSPDGQMLVVSSTDGYCTLITFEDGELGMPYKDQVVVIKTKAEVEEDVHAKRTDWEKRKAKKGDKKGDTQKEITTDTPNKDSMPARSPQRQDAKGLPQVNTMPNQTKPTQASTPKRRIQVLTLTTLEANSDATESDDVMDDVSCKGTSTSQIQKSNTRSPRRVTVTTLHTLPNEQEEATDNTTTNLDANLQEEAGLHLVLEDTCDSAPTPAHGSNSSSSSSANNSMSSMSNSGSDKQLPSTPKVDKKDAAPKRRIAVTTLETFSSSQ